MFRTLALVVFGSYLLMGCGGARLTATVPVPVLPDEVQFRMGLAALHEFTPAGYARAIEHFHAAAGIAPQNCRYRLHEAEVSLLLALEQKLNAENFRPAWEQGADPQCAPGTSFALRLAAFQLLDDFGPTQDRTAINKINEAIELDPADPLNWIVRWKLNPSTNRQENAVLKAAELAPDLALVQYELGNYWLVTADYVQARRAFERALEESPKHFRALIGLAQAISATDANEDVEDLYKRAVEIAPDFLEGRLLLGDYYSGLEENELAREQYLEVLKRNPRFEGAYVRLGLNYLQTAELDAAELAFTNAIDLNASSYQAYYYLGNIWLSRGDFGKARRQYEESLKFVLNFPEAVYALGAVFFREGKIDDALAQFEKVLRMNPSHADAYFSRAGVRVRQRQFSGAIEDYLLAGRLYEHQVEDAIKAIAEYDERGLARKAEAERKRRERLENIIDRTRQLKMKAEDDKFVAETTRE
jgi:tetratricopeptide (TPR) repeat protein